MKNQPKLGSRFISILTSQVVTISLTIVTTPIIIRSISPSEYGNYAFIISIFGILTSLLTAGVFNGTRKFIAEEREIEDWTQSVFTYYLIVGIFISVSASFFIALITIGGLTDIALGREDLDMLFYLLALLLVSNQIFSILRGTLMGGGLEKFSEPITTGRTVVFSIVGIALVLIGYGAVGLLAARVISTSVVIIPLAYFTYSKMSMGIKYVSNNLPKKELLTYNWESILFSVLVYSLYQLDVFMLRIFATGQVTGYYKAALVIAEFLAFVPQAIQMLLVQSASSLGASGSLNKVNKTLRRITRLNSTLVVILAIGLFVLSDEFVRLYYGQNYSQSVLPLRVLIPGVIGLAISRPIFAAGQGVGSLRPLIYASGAATLINFILNILLIPRWGGIGAAVSTSISYALMLVFHIIAAKEIGISLRGTKVFPIAAGGMVALIILIGMDHLITGILSMIILPIPSLILYLFIVYIFGGFEQEEIEYVFRLIGYQTEGEKSNEV